ncbi:integrase core domain-containing [Paramuricea clavata]|uniref:Integrase core domain-containing n=1 Tax=Paramuricea clavata TaxID=317549 RepID=A0A7D9HNN8_PARCT|nr:integrase core domain-containing [Paramuricea clavata]
MTKAVNFLLEEFKKRFGKYPEVAQFDEGKEFYNVGVRNLLQKHNVRYFSTNSDRKAAIVERFNRTLKTMMWKYFYSKGTYDWFNVIDELTNNYNRTKHSSILMRSADVNKSNKDQVWITLYGYGLGEFPLPKFRVDNTVRITRYKNIFTKGYEANFTEEIFKVVKVFRGDPNMYEIESHDGEPIIGKFYEEELAAVDKRDDVYRVEKILRRRKGMVLVKWLGYDSKHNSWIPEENIKDIKYMADIELEETNRDNDREAEEAGTVEEETSFIDNDDGRRDESILIPIGFNPDVDGSRPSSSTPNIRRDVGVMKRAYTLDKKDFLKRELGVNINKGDGPSSTIIFDKMKLTVNKAGTKINGATFKDVKIIISKNGKMIYSADKNKESVVNEYKELIRKAKIEHSKTPAALVEEQLERQNLDAPQELVDNVLENIVERMDDELSNQSEAIGNSTIITENELRELRGILNVKGNSGKQKIEYLGVERNHWKELARIEQTAGREQKALLYEAMADMAELKADEIRLRSNERPKGPKALSIVEEETEISDLTRFERFKKWAKENIAGISAVAISVAGIITTIIMEARSVARKGARATSKFAKAMANLAGKVGPVLASVLNLIAKVLGWGTKGIAFLAKNLWILALALTYFLYNEYKKKK